MEKIQMQFTIATETMEALRTAAEKKDITPNILVRLILHEYLDQFDEESKEYTFSAQNWRDIEAYVKEKKLGKVEIFAAFAIERYMSQYPLKSPKKRQGGENIEK